MMKPRCASRIAGVGVLGVCAALAGCAAGHGKHTEEFKEESVNRLAALKAATTWDMAYQQFKSGDLAKAIKTVDQAILLEPTVAKSHSLRARILFEMDRPEPAMASADEAIRLDPTLTEAHYIRGNVLERVSEFSLAAESYLKAAELDTTDPQYVLAAAEMLIQLDRLDEAESMLASKAGFFAHNAGIRQTLGHIAMMRKQPQDAVRLFGEAVLLAPSDTGILEDLARAQIEAGDFGAADTALVRLLKKSTVEERRDLVYMRVRCLMELDRPVEARSILQAVVRSDAGASDAHAWTVLGQVALKLQDQNQLRLVATRLMAIAPQDEGGYVLMAMWHKRNGTPAQGVDILDRAARVSDLSVEGMLLRCVLCQDLGDMRGALASATRATEIDPTDERAFRLVEALTASASMAGVSDTLE
jgi:Tfp pilus assembly protein PilF